jgi:hypothetical protein
VPFTTLWPTFFAVCTELFATFFAVLTGPASTVPKEIAKARIIEKNAFIVLSNSFLTARLLLSARIVWQHFLAALRQISKMASSELSTGAAFQIFLERARFALGFERNSSFDSPWSVLRSMGTISAVVFDQALLKITGEASVVNRFILPTHENVNINEAFHLAGLPSRSL